MKLVGITGSYSSGKTFLLEYLQKQNFNIFSADEFVRHLYKDPNIQDRILKILPSLPIFDKVLIAKLIYQDEKSRKSLENFIHPLVLNALFEFKKNNESNEIIFAEIPLLFEANFEKYFDYIITTYCEDKVRYQRAQTKNGFNQEKFDRLKEIQFSQELKISKSDIAINTNETLENLEVIIQKILRDIK